MKKQHTFTGFVLVGIGAFFLLKQLQLPLFFNFYSWPTILIILGIALLLHSYITNDYKNLFTGVIVLGIGIHFHGLTYYSFWIDDWGMYFIIIAIAYFVRFQKTKSGLFSGLLFLGIGLFVILTPNEPIWMKWLNRFFQFAEDFWPIIVIGLGLYMFVRKK
ncbi:DUF5668 domain-containing protein [Aquibacillus sp. 3ASR75-11]|uniref:DUF5668 domain-containing protein n=1 Tax=Terrihalobacillus insolitus TaxID=2950438 RepID=A0A9X4AMW7_9BACI|nr:DUF5668 domain-containing protein [Terrihalobacillus insolitus]MDC3412491.1 DUF5668 domain-containing protein [Terrihalobacillus insolitus]MDC3423910.1 DUF5668 domain-containing protein [Terrihalobacillus insolitus]